MNLLYLCTDPGIDLSGNGGGSIHMRSLIRALVDGGHRVTAVCSSVRDVKGTAADLQAAIHPAPLNRANRRLVRAIREANVLLRRPPREHPDLVRALHNLTFLAAARRALRENAPDFLYERYSLWGVSGARLSVQSRVPLVLEVNAPLVYEHQCFRGLAFPALARRVECEVWGRAALVIAVSDHLRAHLEDAGVRPERIVVMPNGVEPAPFLLDAHRESIRRDLGLTDRFVVGLVSTFKPWHGADLLLDAFASLYQIEPSAILVLVGDGPLRVSLENRVRAAGLQGAVHFAGTVAHDRIARYVIAMDVAVLPYPALEHPYYSPLKLFEYMAAGRAIAASRTGQITRVLEDRKNALLFEPGNARELASCLRRLCQDRTMGADLGQMARIAVRGYSWRGNADKLIAAAEPICERQRKGAYA